MAIEYVVNSIVLVGPPNEPDEGEYLIIN